jgi:long-chain acyl-CoA synthetase
MNIGEYLDRNAAKYEDQPLLFYYDRTLTYREFREKVDALADGLRGLGFKKGDFIHVWVLNSPETLISFFAIQKIGAIAGPINGSWQADEVEYLLNDSRGRGLIVGAQYFPILDEIRGKCPHLETIVEVSEDPRPERVSFQRLLAESSPDPIECPAKETDPAYIFYTSGTTGNPKGVLLSHKNVLADIKCFQDALRLEERYRILIFLPLFHVNAMLTSTSTIDKGGAVVLRKQFSAGEFWPVVEQYRPHFFSAVPAVYSILLTDPGRDKYDKSSLEFGICGAAPMPVETFREFETTFGIPLVEGYGLTEGTCVSTLNPRDGVRKIGSIGLACPGQEVLIVGEDGNELAAGEAGEIVVRGDVVMMGYHNKPTETEEALAGGVLHTGDVGYKDEDGYIFIVDRLKDMVIRGGENIYPKEIDNLLVEHPRIRDAACVGVPDEVLGEELCAYVIAREGETLDPAEIRDYCAQRLASYKVPKYVRVLDRDFPRNAVGKILKKEMRSWKVDENAA